MQTQVLIAQTKYIAKQATPLLIALMLPMLAHADLAGGLNQAKSEINTTVMAVYGIVGVIAIGYLLFKFVESWTGRADWKEMGLAVIHVAIAGSVVVLAPWAWNYFTGKAS